jgi:glycosyl transferase family 87
VGAGRSSERAATLLAAVLAAAGLAQAWDLARRSPGSDFYQFWMVAQVIGRADVPSIYDEEAHARLGAEFIRRSLSEDDSERRRRAAREWPVLQPTATPLLYSAFRPLTSLDYEHAHLVFRTVSLAAVAAGLLGIALIVGHSPSAALLAVAFVTMAFRPLKSGILVGNVSEIQLAAIAAYLWLSSGPDGARRQVAAGAVLAALVLVKPNLILVPVLLAAVWLTRGRRRKLKLQAVGAAAGGILGLAFSALVFGSLMPWRDWLEYLKAFPPEHIPLRLGNLGLARIAYEAKGLRLSPALTVVSLGLALAGVWAGRSRGAQAAPDDPARAAAEDTAALAAGTFVYLLSAPLVWDHYLLLALPGALLLLRNAHEPGPGGDIVPRALVGTALLLLAIDPLANLLWLYDMYAQAALTAAGLLVLFGLTVRELARPRP